MYQQIAIKPSSKPPLANHSLASSDYTGLDLSTTSIPASSIIKTSKTWVLPPRPKPGRKTSISHKRKSLSAASTSTTTTSGCVKKASPKRKDMLYNKQKSNSICTDIIGNDSLLARNLDDCTSIFLKFEDDDTIQNNVSVSTSMPTKNSNTTTTAAAEYNETELANLISTSLSRSLMTSENSLDEQINVLPKDDTKLTNEEVSSLFSSSTGSPNSIFSSDHYGLSNTGDLLTLSRFDTNIDLAIDNSNLNFKLLNQNVSPTSDFLPINFINTFDSDCISPTLEDIINEQEKS